MGATWKRDSPFHKVLDVILYLRGTLLACYAAKSRERADRKARGSLSDYNAPLCLDCLLNTRKNSTVRPRDFADDHAPLVFEAIETIIWKLPIVPVIRIVSKFFETIRAIGSTDLASRLRGIKQKKSSWGSEMNNTFSCFIPTSVGAKYGLSCRCCWGKVRLLTKLWEKINVAIKGQILVTRVSKTVVC